MLLFVLFGSLHLFCCVFSPKWMYSFCFGPVWVGLFSNLVYILHKIKPSGRYLHEVYDMT